MWRVDNDAIHPELASANLSGLNLSGFDLSYANLFNANLQGTDLSSSNFTEANLIQANLNGATLHKTVFSGSNLRDAIVDSCVHKDYCFVDMFTLQKSNLPAPFLARCGLPDTIIKFLASFQFYSSFLAYSERDSAFVNRLHADLQNAGVRCWFAPHDLPLGAKTWETIDEAIRSRDKLLVVLSKASIASDWVEDEVAKAYAEERSRKEIVLFPIRIDDAVFAGSEPWTMKLRDQRNIGDFTEWHDPEEYQRSFERLLRDLRITGR
jgi:hypothetical protein